MADWTSIALWVKPSLACQWRQARGTLIVDFWVNFANFMLTWTMLILPFIESWSLHENWSMESPLCHLERWFDDFRRKETFLSPGQTDSQVVASWKLGSTCDSFWPGLACVDLRSLWSRSKLPASQCKFFTVWPSNASLFASTTSRYLRLTRALGRRMTKLEASRLSNWPTINTTTRQYC